jgi:anti-anti-sigma factor
MATFTVRSQAHPPTFSLSGELDMATVPAMDAAIGDAIAQGGPITLEMSGVTFIDASGGHAILRAAKALPSGCIILHGVQGHTERALELMRIGSASNVHINPCTVPV